MKDTDVDDANVVDTDAEKTDERINPREATWGVGLLGALLLGLVGSVAFRIVWDEPTTIPTATLRLTDRNPPPPAGKRTPGGSTLDRSNSPAANGLKWAAAGEPDRPARQPASRPESTTAAGAAGRAMPTTYYEEELQFLGAPTETEKATAVAPARRGEIETRMPKFVAPANDSRTQAKQR